MPCFIRVVEEVLYYTNNLKKAEKILVRVIYANGLENRDAVCQEPTVRSVKLVWKLIDMVAAIKVTQYVNTKLVSLCPVLRNGRWVTQGQLRKGLIQILGVYNLQILMPNQRLAQLVMMQAHNENHDGPAGMLARSRG